jgi:anti-sigma regulatory factor (Ser/Thr protein kinase)
VRDLLVASSERVLRSLSGYLRVMEGSFPPGPRSWSRTLRAGPTTAAEARWFLWEALKDQDVSADMADAALLTTEAASNAARHGKEPIELSISLEEEGLRVSVFDQGLGFDPHEEITRSRGSGVNLIERLSTDWGVDRSEDGTEVWFRI